MSTIPWLLLLKSPRSFLHGGDLRFQRFVVSVMDEVLRIFPPVTAYRLLSCYEVMPLKVPPISIQPLLIIHLANHDGPSLSYRILNFR